MELMQQLVSNLGVQEDQAKGLLEGVLSPS